MPTVDFLPVAQAIQAISLSIAALVAGTWAVFRFWSLGELDKAKGEIEKLQQSIARRGTVNVKLSTRILHRPHSEERFLVAVVSLANIGNHTEPLDLKKGRVWCAKLQRVEAGFPVFYDWIQSALADNLGPILGSALSPGAEEAYEFLVPIASEGLYLVLVNLNGSPEETRAAGMAVEQLGVKGLPVWSAMQWVQVPEATAPGEA